MTQSSEKNNKPLLLGLFTFLASFLFLGFLFTATHILATYGEGIFLGLVIMVCFFAAKAVFEYSFKKNQGPQLGSQIIGDVSISAKELYTELYQNSPVPYMIIDFEGDIISANLAASRIFGLSQSKITGTNVFTKLQGESTDHFEMLIEKFKAKIPVSDEIVTIPNPGGKDKWGMLSIHHFAGNSNTHTGILTLVDISKQKQIENAKSEFVSLASHQLRTPIAGIKWSVELLQMDTKGVLTDTQKKYTDRILVGVSRMAVLVDDFLRVSRFELGTFQPEYVTTNVADVLNSVIAEQAPRAAQKKLETKVFLDSEVAEIVTDKNLLRMMITNLYSNAVKYTKEKGTVHVGFKKTDQRIVFSVADNGMGIPITDQEYIFSKLYRASNATRNVPDGTGLGLYIVKEAAEVLKGKVDFTSVENVGSTFEIALPLVLPSKD